MARTNLAFAAMRYRPLWLGKKSGEEFRALLIAKSKIGCKITIFFWTISNNLQKIRILYNAFNIKKGQETLTNACAVLVLCFDYIHSFIVKFVLNPKRINTTLNNFLYICNINACSKSTSVNNMQFWRGVNVNGIPFP